MRPVNPSPAHGRFRSAGLVLASLLVISHLPAHVDVSPENFPTLYPRGPLGTGPLAGAPLRWDEDMGMFTDDDGQPVFLLGLRLTPGTFPPGATLWTLAPRTRQAWIQGLVGHGINCVALEVVQPVSPETVATCLDQFRRWGLRLLPLPAESADAVTPWAPLGASPALIRVEVARWPSVLRALRVGGPLSREMLVEAAMERCCGVLMTTTSRWEEGDLHLLSSFALWASAVPWQALEDGPARTVAQDRGPRVRRRGAPGGRHALFHVPAVSADASSEAVTLPDLAAEPLLLDVFNLRSLRRRRFPIVGPSATAHLTADELSQGCLLLVTPLPPDWVQPDPSLK